MAEKARKLKVSFRPHFKTHQSHEVGRWFRAEGVNSCTVSSVKMASYFAEDGWKDITVAFPLNVLEIKEVNRLGSGLFPECSFCFHRNSETNKQKADKQDWLFH
ncbi:MAG: hypothetical protein WDN75_09720 [Bacteroidota bacterium]